MWKRTSGRRKVGENRDQVAAGSSAEAWDSLRPALLLSTRVFLPFYFSTFTIMQVIQFCTGFMPPTAMLAGSLRYAKASWPIWPPLLANRLKVCRHSHEKFVMSRWGDLSGSSPLWSHHQTPRAETLPLRKCKRQKWKSDKFKHQIHKKKKKFGAVKGNCK